MPHPPHHSNRPPEPRRRDKDKGLATVTASTLGALLRTGFIALSLKTVLKLPLTTVLPTSAPIWMGFSTMFFSVMKK